MNQRHDPGKSMHDQQPDTGPRVHLGTTPTPYTPRIGEDVTVASGTLSGGTQRAQDPGGYGGNAVKQAGVHAVQ